MVGRNRVLSVHKSKSFWPFDQECRDSLLLGRTHFSSIRSICFRDSRPREPTSLYRNVHFFPGTTFPHSLRSGLRHTSSYENGNFRILDRLFLSYFVLSKARGPS